MNLDVTDIRRINEKIKFSSLWIGKVGVFRTLEDRLRPYSIKRRNLYTNEQFIVARYSSVRDAARKLEEWGLLEPGSVEAT